MGYAVERGRTHKNFLKRSENYLVEARIHVLGWWLNLAELGSLK